MLSSQSMPEVVLTMFAWWVRGAVTRRQDLSEKGDSEQDLSELVLGTVAGADATLAIRMTLCMTRPSLKQCSEPFATCNSTPR